MTDGAKIKSFCRISAYCFGSYLMFFAVLGKFPVRQLFPQETLIRISTDTFTNHYPYLTIDYIHPYQKLIVRHLLHYRPTAVGR